MDTAADAQGPRYRGVTASGAATLNRISRVLGDMVSDRNWHARQIYDLAVKRVRGRPPLTRARGGGCRNPTGTPRSRAGHRTFRTTCARNCGRLTATLPSWSSGAPRPSLPSVRQRRAKRSCGHSVRSGPYCTRWGGERAGAATHPSDTSWRRGGPMRQSRTWTASWRRSTARASRSSTASTPSTVRARKPRDVAILVVLTPRLGTFCGAPDCRRGLGPARAAGGAGAARARRCRRTSPSARFHEPMRPPA